MKKNNTLIAFLLIIQLNSNSQKVSINDISLFLKNTDQGAERLISKGFISEGKYAVSNGFSYNLKDSKISLEVMESENCEKYITICYGKQFQKDFILIKNQILNTGKKISFFYNNYYNIYFTEYYSKGIYFYLSKGFCFEGDYPTNYYTEDVIFCSNQQLKKGNSGCSGINN